MSSAQYRQFMPLYAVIFLGFLGYALTITLFIPMLMSNNFPFLSVNSSTALRVTLSGLLLAMYPLGQFLGSPIIGNLSDHLGRKKILLLSLLLCMLGFIGMALSIQFHQVVLLFISAFFTGLCESNMAISQTIIADQAQDAIQKTKLIGYAYSACSLGYVIGPLLGGMVASKLGYSIPFWITALGVLMIVFWIFYGFQDQYIPNKVGAINIFNAITALKSIVYQKKLHQIYLVNFLIFFSVQGLYRVVPLYIMDKWHPTIFIYSLIIAYVSLLGLIANLFILGKLAHQFRTQQLLTGLLVLSGFCAFIIIIPDHLHWIWLTYAMVIIPTVMVLPTCTSWLSQHAVANEQGQVLGNNQALLVLGESSSAMIGGLIAACWVPLPIIVMGVILLMTGLRCNKR